MEHYVDGFLIPVRRDRIEQYKAMASLGAAVWKEHGALEYYECVGDDLEKEGMASFLNYADCGPDEIPVFSWIVYPSREDRDRINAAVMADPRLRDMMHAEMPFEIKRMAYGGFRTLVRA